MENRNRAHITSIHAQTVTLLNQKHQLVESRVVAINPQTPPKMVKHIDFKTAPRADFSRNRSAVSHVRKWLQYEKDMGITSGEKVSIMQISDFAACLCGETFGFDQFQRERAFV
jgi:hypothetical protein